MSETATTLLDALQEALQRAAQYNHDDQVAPVAILWPDKERQWAALIRELRPRLPLLTFGDYSPADRCGPAPYIRCMIGRTLSEDRLPDDATPIIYLPGFSRQDLRAIEECPRNLQPLAGLQYSGVLWTHKNGRDWTIAGFLQSADGGLGIPVAADNATREALSRALPVLAREPLSHLRKEAALRAPFLDGLLNPDEARRLLLWMNDPKGYRAGVGQPEWTAFCNLCQHKYAIHPQQDGELAAAARLGQPKGAWEGVWQRFLEAPDAYPKVPELLRRARPAQLTLFEKKLPYWPQDIESAETELRESLLALKDRLPAESRTAINELEAKHGPRRGWVWAKLEAAPLAEALVHLLKLAQLSEKSLGGATATAIADAYADWGWQVDAAVLAALAAVGSAEDVAALKAGILPLYRPWLEKAALAFQQAILPDPTHCYVTKPAFTAAAGACLLFSDALRFDVGQQLIAHLERRGLTCHSRHTLAALPPVTPTAKPAISPVAAQFAGGSPGLVAVVKATGAAANAVNLRKLLGEAGYEVLSGDECGDPAGKAWTEIGAIDQYGHGHGWKIAWHLRGELRALEERIAQLLAAGWQRVVVITDHGWLMLPGGLPKADLPQHLTLERKGRCAVLKDGAQTDQPTVPWRWDPDVCIAVAPGIACYEAGLEYDHGGLSPQECVVPIIEVTVGGSAAPVAAIKQVSWKGLRCQVELAGAAAGLSLDIRTKAADPASSIVDKIKPVGADGRGSLLVPDDDRLGEAALVIVIAENGASCAQALTTVGG